MTSFASCSAKAACVASVMLLAACSAPRIIADTSWRVNDPVRLALFPMYNLSGGSIPARDITTAVELALRRAGLDVVGGDIVERFLAAKRLRFTGGLERETARAIRDELAADGVIIVTVEHYSAAGSPRFACSMRLVSSEDPPRILWIDGVSSAGDESPGLLGLGVVDKMPELRRDVLNRLSRSLQAFLRGTGSGAVPCDASRRFKPRVTFRSPVLDSTRRRTVAVLPFVNETDRRDAGELVALQFVRQLAATSGFEVLEPGIVRAALLRLRVIQEGGVSVEDARVVTSALRADLVVAGHVRAFDEAETSQAAPEVGFTVLIIARDDRRVLWQSSSQARGDDGVLLFRWGKVATAPALTCRMTRSVVEQLASD